MAAFRSALGQREQAFAELERACAENAAPLFAMNVDPKLDALRNDRRVAALFASLYGQPNADRAGGIRSQMRSVSGFPGSPKLVTSDGGNRT
jgi:hypothetical protein